MRLDELMCTHDPSSSAPSNIPGRAEGRAGNGRFQLPSIALIPRPVDSKDITCTSPSCSAPSRQPD